MFYEEGNLLILQWCLNHPWMTFFIILAIIGSVTKIIGYIASTINNA